MELPADRYLSLHTCLENGLNALLNRRTYRDDPNPTIQEHLRRSEPHLQRLDWALEESVARLNIRYVHPRWRSIRSRKTHQCHLCAGPIGYGETYYADGQGLFESGIRYCVHCFTANMLCLQIDTYPPVHATHWDCTRKQEVSLTNPPPSTLSPKTYRFTAVVIQDPTVSYVNHIAYCPALTGCHALGHTPAEALAALEGAIHDRMVLARIDGTDKRLPTEVCQQTVEVTVPFPLSDATKTPNQDGSIGDHNHEP